MMPLRIAVLAAAGLALAGCASGTSTASESRSEAPESPAPITQTPLPTASEIEAPPVAVTTPAQTIFTFGQTATYTVGPTPYSLTVSAPEEFTPSKYAATSGTGTPIVVQITVRNDGTGVLDPTLLYASASSGGAEAGTIFDSEAGITSAPSTPVLPGQSVSWKAAFQVVDPAQVVMEVSGVSYEYNGTIFTS